ncbi:MAG: homoserine O-acetyltransferase/O-succinyltransferase family protein [Sarcina sp.]
MTVYVSKNIEGAKELTDNYDIKGKECPLYITKIGIINLMPTKCKTESQILKLICETNLEVEVEFIRLDSYNPKNINIDYLKENYSTFNEVKNALDILIVTGAPLENLDFEEVEYIKELREILNYSKINIKKLLFICWSAQMALNHFYGIRKHIKKEKIFGIFSHEIINQDEVLNGINSGFKVPHSRYTRIEKDDIKKNDLKVISIAENGEEHLLKGRFNDFYLLGHIEYDKETLKDEYMRDLKKGLKIKKPENYFINDDIEEGINFNWQADAIKFYKNFIKL